MKLKYLQIRFNLKFEREAFVDNNPNFLIRSILGKNLKKSSCSSSDTKCFDCLFNEACAYARIFETLVTSQKSHPYSITKNSDYSRTMKEYDFTLTLFGFAVGYSKHIVSAIESAGNDGLFRQRVKFSVQSTVQEIKEFDSEKIEVLDSDEILLNIKTPLRFRINGRYSENFTSTDLFKCFFRRMRTLCSIYGECGEEEKFAEFDDTDCIVERNISWTDLTHYSSRQKKSMELGGITGAIGISKKFTQLESAVLKFCEIANAGKNTVFGLGQITVWKK